MHMYFRIYGIVKFYPLMLFCDSLFMSVCIKFCVFYGSGVIVCGFLDLHIRKVMQMVSFDLSIILTFLLLHYVIFISIFVLVTSLLYNRWLMGVVTWFF